MKTLQSVTLTQTAGGPLALFGLSGLGSIQAYANTVNVTADSTIDVQNVAGASLGGLNIGTKTL